MAQRILTSDEMRRCDRLAAEEHGVPTLTLMENAGRAVADRALALLGPAGRAWVVCGGGNNGGDGYVALRHLHASGRDARALGVAARDQLKGDAKANADAAADKGARIEPFANGALDAAGTGDVVVDALLGTGLSRAPEGPYLAAIDAVNRARRRGARVLAVDLPSGLDADSGFPLGFCVHADATVTFAYFKMGLVLYPGAELAGKVHVADIGIPHTVESHLGRPRLLVEDADVRGWIPRRKPDAHKGTFGHVLIVAGSPGKTGAAQMCAMGALRGGAGLVTLAARAEVLRVAQPPVPEMMGEPLGGDGPLTLDDLGALAAAAALRTALAVGPGLARGPETARLIAALLAECKLPSVLDADALNALAEGEPAALLAGARKRPVLTPHPGEMARLLRTTTHAVQTDRVGTAERAAHDFDATVVLKGARTVIADPEAPTRIVAAGNPGMATGGTGDVLTGLVAALLAQGLPRAEAACAAAHVHARAGDLMARERGMMGMIATDLLEGIWRTWGEWGL